MEEVVIRPIIPGDVAWILLALAIVGYDVTAVTTKKAETMSSAIWRSLRNPYKFPVTAGIWLGITWHLFLNPQARHSYKVYSPKIEKIRLTKRGTQ